MCKNNSHVLTLSQTFLTMFKPRKYATLFKVLVLFIWPVAMTSGREPESEEGFHSSHLDSCGIQRPGILKPITVSVSCTCVLPEDQPGHDDGEDGCRALHRLRKRHRHILQANQAQNHCDEPGRWRQR